MTGVQKYVNSWFKYNNWRYDIIYKYLKKNKELINPEKDELIYFSNIKSTLDHTLLADILWYMRIFNEKEINLNKQNFEYLKIGDLSKGNYSELIHNDKNKNCYLENLHFLQKEIINLYLKEIKTKENNELFFMEDIYYNDTMGNKIMKNRFDCFYHVINHSTHHIGQISSIISKYDKLLHPELDFTNFLNDLNTIENKEITCPSAFDPAHSKLI
jgi:uncharacterized damage-inducible protein DinB